MPDKFLISSSNNLPIAIKNKFAMKVDNIVFENEGELLEQWEMFLSEYLQMILTSTDVEEWNNARLLNDFLTENAGPEENLFWSQILEELAEYDPLLSVTELDTPIDVANIFDLELIALHLELLEAPQIH